MKQFRLLLVFTLITSFGSLQAQDIHYSLFHMSPLTLNPAQTGAFLGSIRIGGIYRDQWASVIKNQFTTPSFYADAPIMRGFRPRDWVGVGLMVYSDQAGTGKLRTNASMLSASYHLALNKDGKSILTLGVQGGNVSRRFDINSLDLRFEDEFGEDIGGGGLGVGAGQDRGGAGQDDLNASYLDFNGGLMFRSEMDNDMNLELGVAFGHVTSPRYGLLSFGNTNPNPNPNPNPGGNNSNKAKRPWRTTAHGRLKVPLTDMWSITPGFLWQNTAGANEIALQNWVGRKVNEDFTLNAGLAYRFSDAAEVLLGADYKDLRVALSYDVNVSSLNEVSNFKGGFEIAAYYIIKIYQKPTVKPAILCPRF